MPQQFSLRNLFVVLAAASLCLAVANTNFFVEIALLLTYVACLKLMPIRPDMKRRLVYGAIGGTCLVVAVAFSIAYGMGEPPQYWHGPGTPMGFARQFAVPIGGFFGAIIGCGVASRSRRAVQLD